MVCLIVKCYRCLIGIIFYYLIFQCNYFYTCSIRSFLKSCAVCLCGVLPFLRTWVRSLRDRNFRKEDNNANDAFRQQSGPLPARQRSDPLPEGMS
jgi:hypothetical protein